MTQAVTLFRSTMEELQHFASDRNTYLKTLRDGRIIAAEKPTGPMRLFLPTSTSSDTVEKVADFVEYFEDWFTPSERDKQVLGHLKRAFPRPLFGVCNDIFDRMAFGATFDRSDAFSSRQDLKLCVDSPQGPMSCWAHMSVIGEEALNRFFQACDASPVGDAIHLNGLPAEALRLGLNLLYGSRQELPQNPETLALILRYVDKLSLLTSDPTLETRCRDALTGSMDETLLFDLISSVNKWDSPLGSCLVDLCSYGLHDLAEHSRLGEIPAGMFARMLDGDLLLGPEASIYHITRKWALLHSRLTDVYPGDVLTRPVLRDQSVLNLIRFKLFDLESFVRLLSPSKLLSQEEFNSITRYLGTADHDKDPLEAPRRRSAILKYEDPDRNSVRIRWHASDINALLNNTDGFVDISSPSLIIGGARWRLCLQQDQIGLSLGMYREPSFEAAEPGLWKLTYTFPRTGASISGTRRLTDESTHTFRIFREKYVWAEQADVSENYLPIEVDIRIHPITSI